MGSDVVLIGAGAVGKSMICMRVLGKSFEEEYDPTIEDNYRETITVDGKDYPLRILDTAGQPEYSAMRSLYMRRGKTFLFVYDIRSRRSFDQIGEFYTELVSVKQEISSPVKLVILGSKSDLEHERQVSTEDGEDLAEHLNSPFFECSAATNTNILPAFAACVRLMNSTQTSTVRSSSQGKKNNGCLQM